MKGYPCKLNLLLGIITLVGTAFIGWTFAQVPSLLRAFRGGHDRPAVTVTVTNVEAGKPVCRDGWCVTYEVRGRMDRKVTYLSARENSHQLELEMKNESYATIRFETDDKIRRVEAANEDYVTLENAAFTIENNNLILRTGSKFPKVDTPLPPITSIQVEMNSGRAFMFKIIPTPYYSATLAKEHIVSYTTIAPPTIQQGQSVVLQWSITKEQAK